MADWGTIMRAANRRARKTGVVQRVWTRRAICMCWRSGLPHIKADGTTAKAGEIAWEYYLKFQPLEIVGDAEMEVIAAARAWAPTRLSRASAGNRERLRAAVWRLNAELGLNIRG